MPRPDLDSVWIETSSEGAIITYQDYYGTGNEEGNRKKRVAKISERIARGSWSCRWCCANPLPSWRRCDALYCSERCRKRFARTNKK